MSKSSKSMIILVVSSILLCGCAVAPTVQLTRIDAPTDVKGDEVDTFYLRKSAIKIDKADTSSKKENAELPLLTIQSVVEEYDNFKIGVRRADELGVRTSLNITKISNTELIKEAGVEVDDKRVELINKVGAIITKIPALGIASDPNELEPDDLPKVIQISDILKDKDIRRDAALGIEMSDGIKIDIGQIPPDAVEINDLKMPIKLSGLIYSSCRSATIEFKFGDQKYVKAVKINDPRYLQRIAFPIKGKVSFHTECGVSVTSEKDIGVSTGADIVDALAIQGKAIKDAIDAAKKDNK
uniref:Lipoprotein n=1 Tax=Candidatus Kentrum sp. LFY TaxID=2126342 RepID=A0A450WNS1_9GAMM|nr:MAG: hypothetical protein BECKLFY1418C_GA0070996_10477 [Candidatus Kentron sp. LFY]